jgi:hypothetical protein
VSFEVEGGKEAAFRFSNALRIMRISNNLGDAKSLITHPATTTHQRLTPEARAELGISDGLLRLSVGLEAPTDLEADLARALRPPAAEAMYRATTRGIVVTVEPAYSPERSSPEDPAPISGPTRS